jgi:hypothetical protein
VDSRSNAGVVARAVLVVATVANGGLGVWATIAPRGFYDHFPGFGKVWVAVDGPFNEHLIRDVGSWSLGLAVLVVAAAWTLERRLVMVAGIALTLQGILHAEYHLAAANPFDSVSEQVQAVSGIVLLAVAGAVTTFLAWRTPDASTPAPPRK